MLTRNMRQRTISMLLLQTAAAILLIFSINGYAQSTGDNYYQNAAQQKKEDQGRRGLLNAALRWAADDTHGIVMGTIQSIDMQNGTIKVLNQEITIDDETLFLGTLKSVADLKLKRVVIITTELKDDKLTAVEVYRLPKPKKKNQ